MGKSSLRAFSIFAFCFLGSGQGAARPQYAGEVDPARLSLAEAYSCTLNVWNKEIQPGAQDVKLREFRLQVEATGLPLASSAAEQSVPKPTGHFWLQQLDLQYLPGWQGQEAAGSTDSSMDWSKVRIRIDAHTELPLGALTAQDTLDRIDIRSALVMSRNDLMRIGIFRFQPALPGVYELRFQLKGKDRLAYALKRRLEFFCPLPRLRLSVTHDGAVHEAATAYSHIPLVASTFFAPHSSRPNANETDRLFRSLFWGLLAQRIACTPSPANLLLLDEPAERRDDATSMQAAQQRSEYLLQLLRAKARIRSPGLSCGEAVGASAQPVDGATSPDSCVQSVTMRTATAAEAELYLKSTASEVSPEWFAEENRVVPLVAPAAVQSVIFAPLQIKSQEESDYVTFRCTPGVAAEALDCLRGGTLEVSNARGETCRQEIAPARLAQTLQGMTELRLDAPPMQAFLRDGTYRAVLKLFDRARHELIESDTVSFNVTRKAIVRDEVFALSPYDRVGLTYELDRERVARLSREILQSWPAEAREILVLISGHSDSLGEHRSQGYGRNYNLALSFGRAIYLKNIFVDSLLAHARQTGDTWRMVKQQFAIPAPLQEALHKRMQEIGGEQIVGLGGGDHAEGDPSVHSYLDLVGQEKARHFRCEPEGSSPSLVPSSADILARCHEMRALTPMEIVTWEVSPAPAPRRVTIVTVGLGAAVPFYRKLEISPELREIFCRMGYSEGEMPDDLFGRDRYPAGRLMNRRVELNVLW